MLSNSPRVTQPARGTSIWTEVVQLYVFFSSENGNSTWAQSLVETSSAFCQLQKDRKCDSCLKPSRASLCLPLRMRRLRVTGWLVEPRGGLQLPKGLKWAQWHLADRSENPWTQRSHYWKFIQQKYTWRKSDTYETCMKHCVLEQKLGTA